MRAPLSWLRELTPLPAAPSDHQGVAELAGELSSLGLVVEKLEWVGEGLEDVVLARVLEISRIEGADRIRKVVVDRGDDETVEVVCGAWNFEEGDVVVLAPVGSELPGGFRIERRKMRGQVSNGMLCSGRELALSDEHEGILVLASPRGELPSQFVLGTSLAEHLGIGRDVVFHLEVEPNRPDCLSMVGIARDLAARYGLPLELPEPRLVETEPSADRVATVEIEAPELCSRFVARVLTGLKPAVSPAVMRRRLHLAGMRPISLLVDASNYVMLELGQPNHPYDLERLGGQGLRVRAAHKGESIVTLDGETRILGGRLPQRGDPVTALDAVICNLNDVPVGIAGVMGGRSSEIAEDTTSVLLEVACFDPVAVGRTARHLGLRTEASIRFERGVDPEGLERAAARFCQLVVDATTEAGLEPPAVAHGLSQAVARTFEPTRIKVRPSRVNGLLGTSLGSEEMVALLSPIGFRAQPAGEGEDSFEVVVPSHRPDVTIEQDVAEEVARTFGYRRIEATNRRSPRVGRLDEMQAFRRRLRRILCGLGADEAWSTSLVARADQVLTGVTAALVPIANPMVAEHSVLRGGLMAGLLQVLRHNAGHRNGALRLFEIGDVFGLVSSEGGRLVPDERERVALLLAREGDGAEEAMRCWHVISEALGLAGIELVQPGLRSSSALSEEPVGQSPAARGEPTPDLEPDLAGLHPARSGLLVTSAGAAELEGAEASGQGFIGSLGELDPYVLSAFDLTDRRVGWLELDMRRLLEAPRRPELAEAVSRYPSSDIDLAFVLDESVPAARLQETLRLAAGELCESVQLFDVYRGAGLEQGRRSLAFRLRLVALDRTLTDQEVAEVRQSCIDAVSEAIGAELRA
jgi:phenylalanyl-tRNA synthetase beta chain